MTTLELLEKARELIADPNRWTTEVHSRDSAGRPVHPTSGQASCWCISGAIWKCSDDDEYLAGKVWDELVIEAGEKGFETPPDANDYGGHDVILSVIDATIARLKAEA